MICFIIDDSKIHFYVDIIVVNIHFYVGINVVGVHFYEGMDAKTALRFRIYANLQLQIRINYDFY